MSNTEEKSPLLYVLDNNDDNEKTKKPYFERSRFDGITSGATAVFTQFPNYIGTCWVTTAVCGLVFFMMIILLLSAITTTSIRVPRCLAATEVDNKSIHLVHVQNENHWKSSEVELIQEIVKTYPSYKVRLLLVEERQPAHERNNVQSIAISSTSTSISTSTSTEERPTHPQEVKNNKLLIAQRRKRRIDDVRFNINMEAKRLIDMLLHGKLDDKTMFPSSVKTSTTEKPSTTERAATKIDDLLKLYPNLVVEHLTFNQAFFSSPLYSYWPNLNDQLKVFAVRVLQLWQFGGISFDLHAAVEDIRQLGSNITAKENSNNGGKVKQFVISERDNYEDLPVGVVNVDDRALHMESKVPCHAFFGEVLMNLRKSHKTTTVKDIMQRSIKVFCEHFSASRSYCNMFSYN